MIVRRPCGAPLLALLVVVLASGAAAAYTDRCGTKSLDGPEATAARTDHQATGNRVALGCGPLAGEVLDIELGGRPAWLLPDPRDRGGSWFVVLEDGSIEHVVAGPGVAPVVTRGEYPALAPGEPPSVTARDGRAAVESAIDDAAHFADPIPGARTIAAQDATMLALTGPTGRYPHGVLGDDVEASAVTIMDAAAVKLIEVAVDEVIEGLSPLLADLDGDGTMELVVTVSTADAGARLVAYDLGGALVGRSEPIGRGFRWLHQIGAAPMGPDGVVEVVAVRTPHIGGVVETYRLVEGRLELSASLPGYSSHNLGSPNLDMALLADADGDGRLEVVVPTQDMNTLAVLTRSADGLSETASVSLGGRLATNVAATSGADGGLVLAAATEDGRLRVFR